jgi:hypothetical protein
MHKSDGENKKKNRTLLKDIRVKEVSFVGRGANEGARQVLFKTAGDDEEILAKRLFSEVMTDLKADAAAQKLVEEMLESTGFLRYSLREIMEDPRLEHRKDMLRQSVQEFSAAMASMIDNAELIKTLKKIVGKTEQGKVFPAKDYAYVPDKDKSSTWKLRLTSEPGGPPDPRIVGMAVAALGDGFRGQKVQIASEDRASVVARVKKAWLKANKGKSEGDLPAVLKTINNDREDSMPFTAEDMEKLQKKFDEQKIELEKTKFFAGLNDVEKKHYTELNETEKQDFEKMDAETRKKAIAKKEANEETIDIDGFEVRKSEVGDTMFVFMKAQKAKTDAAVQKAEQLQKAAKQKDLETEVEKLWPNLSGAVSEKAIILKSIRALPEEQQKAQLDMMKAADEAMAKSFKEMGKDGTGDEDSPINKLEKMARKYADDNNVTFEKAYTKILETDEGAALYTKSLSEK